MGEVLELSSLPIDREDDRDGANVGSPCRFPPSVFSAVLDQRIRRQRHRSSGHGYGQRDPGVFVPVFSSPSPASSFSFFRIGHCAAASGGPSVSGSDSDDLDDDGEIAVDPFDPTTSGGGMGDPFGDCGRPWHVGGFDGAEEQVLGYHVVGREMGLRFGGEKLWGEDEGFDDVDLEEESDWGDEFLDGARNNVLDSRVDDVEPSSSRDAKGPRGVVGFRSDQGSGAESEEDTPASPHSVEAYLSDVIEDFGLPLSWLCLQSEEESRSLGEEFDWEEVDGRVGQREYLRAVMGSGEDRSMLQNVAGAVLRNEGENQEEETSRPIDGEFLMALNDLEGITVVDHEGAEYFPSEVHEGFVYASEYEILIGQFADHVSFVKGNPPAAKSLVERLPSVILIDDIAICAVCKDDILVEEKAKQLPCSHYYHANCILPWLAIRNTCPVCRFELPTDDSDYESWWAQQASNGGNMQGYHVRQNFDVIDQE